MPSTDLQTFAQGKLSGNIQQLKQLRGPIRAPTFLEPPTQQSSSSELRLPKVLPQLLCLTMVSPQFTLLSEDEELNG